MSTDLFFNSDVLFQKTQTNDFNFFDVTTDPIPSPIEFNFDSGTTENFLLSENPFNNNSELSFPPLFTSHNLFSNNLYDYYTEIIPITDYNYFSSPDYYYYYSYPDYYYYYYSYPDYYYYYYSYPDYYYYYYSYPDYYYYYSFYTDIITWIYYPSYSWDSSYSLDSMSPITSKFASSTVLHEIDPSLSKCEVFSNELVKISADDLFIIDLKEITADKIEETLIFIEGKVTFLIKKFLCFIRFT